MASSTQPRLPPSPESSHEIHSLLRQSEGPFDTRSTPVFEPGSDGWLKDRMAFTVANVLTAAECASLISAAESIGFEKALLNIGYGVQVLDEETRKSQRCIVDSIPLAEAIWTRLKHLIPQTMSSRSGGNIVAVGLNERLRILKYLPGDTFQAHCDGRFARGDEFSVLTLQLYLNECEEGGATTMWSDEQGKNQIERKVECSPGQALVFSHRLWHEGSLVTKGVKYVIRTDIMYTKQNGTFNFPPAQMQLAAPLIASGVPAVTNITIGLVAYYCVLPGLVLNGSLVTNYPAKYNTSTEISFGGIDGYAYFFDKAAEAGVNQVNNDPTLLPGIHVNIKRFSDCGASYPNAATTYSGKSAPFAASVLGLDVIENHPDVVALVGTQYSSTAKGDLQEFSFAQIPFCGGDIGSMALSDKNKYPYFFRTLLGAGIGQHLYRLLRFWEVSRVALVYQSADEYGKTIYLDIRASLLSGGVDVLDAIALQTRVDKQGIDFVYESLVRADARYIILCGQQVWSGGILYGLGKRGLVDENHVFMGNYGPAMPSDPQINVTAYQSYVQGFVVVTAPSVDAQSPAYIQVKQAFDELVGFSMSDSWFILANWAPHFVDCALTIATGLHQLLKSDASFTPTMLAERKLNRFMNFTLFRDTGYQGLLSAPERLQYNSNGDLNTRFTAWYFPSDGGQMIAFGETDKDAETFHYLGKSRAVFQGGGTVPPSDGSQQTTETYDLTEFRGISIMVLISIGILATMAIAMVLVKKPRKAFMHSGFNMETTVSLAGFLVVYMSLFTYIGAIGPTACKFRTAGLMAGLALVATPTLTKNFTVFLLTVQNQKLPKPVAKRIVEACRLGLVGLLAVEAAAVYVWWNAVKLNLNLAHSQFAYQMQCVYLDTSMGGFGGQFLFWWGGLLLAMILVMSFATRAMPLYNESNQLAYGAAVALVALLLVLGITEAPSKNTDFGVCIVVWTFTTILLGILMGVKARETLEVLSKKGRDLVQERLNKVSSSSDSNLPPVVASMKKKSKMSKCINSRIEQSLVYSHRSNWWTYFHVWRSARGYMIRLNPQSTWIMLHSGKSGEHVYCMRLVDAAHIHTRNSVVTLSHGSNSEKLTFEFELPEEALRFHTEVNIGSSTGLLLTSLFWYALSAAAVSALVAVTAPSNGKTTRVEVEAGKHPQHVARLHESIKGLEARVAALEAAIRSTERAMDEHGVVDVLDNLNRLAAVDVLHACNSSGIIKTPDIKNSIAPSAPPPPPPPPVDPALASASIQAHAGRDKTLTTTAMSEPPMSTVLQELSSRVSRLKKSTAEMSDNQNQPINSPRKAYLSSKVQFSNESIRARSQILVQLRSSLAASAAANLSFSSASDCDLAAERSPFSDEDESYEFESHNARNENEEDSMELWNIHPPWHESQKQKSREELPAIAANKPNSRLHTHKSSETEALLHSMPNGMSLIAEAANIRLRKATQVPRTPRGTPKIFQ
ncbi:hypothetical protein HDU78_001840 [Chytriomyces hyalinus]|nr:hypothetical protein HDU78_001840 [Chytriomyces hyalinus]